MSFYDKCPHFISGNAVRSNGLHPQIPPFKWNTYLNSWPSSHSGGAEQFFTNWSLKNNIAQFNILYGAYRCDVTCMDAHHTFVISHISLSLLYSVDITAKEAYINLTFWTIMIIADVILLTKIMMGVINSAWQSFLKLSWLLCQEVCVSNKFIHSQLWWNYLSIKLY